MAGPENITASAEAEARNHAYRGNAIPWYVRLIWIGYWILAIAYVLQWLIPALKTEIANPP